MKVAFDPDKDAGNFAKHGVYLSEFTGFDADPYVEIDDRQDYGEIRYRAFGRVGGVGYSICFTLIAQVFRLISFRRAHEKEMRRYE